MKWILIIILIAVIMLIAMALSEQYKDKYDFYNNLKSFLQQFKINLSFKQDKLIEFLNNTKPKKQFAQFIDCYKDYLNNNELNLTEIKLLDSEELVELENIIKNVGNYDSQNEIQQIDSFLANIELKLNKSYEEKSKLCPMILKLSLLFSIGLAILLI